MRFTGLYFLIFIRFIYETCALDVLPKDRYPHGRGGHFDRVIVRAGYDDKIIPVRGQGGCGYLVAATHTVRKLRFCPRKTGDERGTPKDEATKAMEDGEADRLRGLVADMLEERWDKTPDSGTSLF